MPEVVIIDSCHKRDSFRQIGRGTASGCRWVGVPDSLAKDPLLSAEELT
jgi:hypothetical protein